MISNINLERLEKKNNLQHTIKKIEILQKTNILRKIEKNRLNVVLCELYSLDKFWTERSQVT